MTRRNRRELARRVQHAVLTQADWHVDTLGGGHDGDVEDELEIVACATGDWDAPLFERRVVG